MSVVLRLRNHALEPEVNHYAIVRLVVSFFLLSYLRFGKSVFSKFLVILIWKIILKAIVLRNVYLLTVIKVM